MTRSAYGPAWDDEANARRLAMTVGVTVASMRAQTSRDWSWIVALDAADPLRAERRAAFESAGVPVRVLEVRSETTDRTAAAWQAYRADWGGLIGRRDEVVAMTRLDDDDALAPWVLERVQAVAPKLIRRTALVCPRGVRVWDGRLSIVRHDSNAMQTLVTQAGDDLHVYGYKHREVRRVADLRRIDERFAWVWSRHPDTISGWRMADLPLERAAALRRMFPIDWALFGESDGRVVRGGRVGTHFR